MFNPIQNISLNHHTFYGNNIVIQSYLQVTVPCWIIQDDVDIHFSSHNLDINTQRKKGEKKLDLMPLNQFKKKFLQITDSVLIKQTFGPKKSTQVG